MNEFTLDPTLYDGRPSDCSSRSAAEAACYDFLDGLGVPYRRADHSETPSIEPAPRLKRCLARKSAKPVFVQPPKDPVLPAADAWEQAVPYQGPDRPARLLPPFLRGGGTHARAARRDARLGFGSRPAERHGKPCPSGNRPRCPAAGILRLPSLPEHIFPAHRDRRPDRPHPARPAARAGLCFPVSKRGLFLAEPVLY